MEHRLQNAAVVLAVVVVAAAAGTLFLPEGGVKGGAVSAAEFVRDLDYADGLRVLRELAVEHGWLVTVGVVFLFAWRVLGSAGRLAVRGARRAKAMLTVPVAPPDVPPDCELCSALLCRLRGYPLDYYGFEVTEAKDGAGVAYEHGKLTSGSVRFQLRHSPATGRWTVEWIDTALRPIDLKHLTSAEKAKVTDAVNVVIGALQHRAYEREEALYLRAVLTEGRCPDEAKAPASVEVGLPALAASWTSGARGVLHYH